MKRLKIEEIVRLLVGDELVLVVPPSNSKVPRPAREARRRVVADLQKVIASTWDADNVTPQDRDAFMSCDCRPRKMALDNVLWAKT